MKLCEHFIGHSLQQEQLQQDLATGNVSHAYLLSGPQHLGKMSLALMFACDLLSAHALKEEKQEICAQIEKLTHPDLLVLDQLWIEGVQEDWNEIAKRSNVPQVHRSKKPAAKTDIISIDDVRALQERLNETGTGTYRCLLVRSMERMQESAANAFLKILEEPPEGLVFLLTTQSQATLLPTIVSRTRVLPFRRVSNKEMRTVLSGVSDDDVQFILHIARGAPGRAVQLSKDPDALRAHRIVHSKAQSFWSTPSVREKLHILSPMEKRGSDADDLLLHLALTLRESGVTMDPDKVRALLALSRGLKTNAHRGILLQQFAMHV